MTTYISTQHDKNASGKRKKSDPTGKEVTFAWSKKDLARLSDEERHFAEETWLAFAPYISHEHWGIDKRHRITKAEWVARAEWIAQREQGVEKPRVVIRNEDGSPWLDYNDQPVIFNYYRNYKGKLWKPDKTLPAIEGDELPYYECPARSGKKTPYLDLDAHDEWQDDLDKAIDLLKQIFKDKVFYRYSHGGYNAWPKIGDAPAAKEYNEGLARLERVLKDTFAQRKIKTSIEVKGRSVWGKVETFDDRRSHLAKLPYWNHRYPCQQKDDDDNWNFRRLREFKETPDLQWKSLMSAVDQVEAMLDPEKVAEGKRYLQLLKTGEPVVVIEKEEVPEEPSSPRSQADACEMPPPAAVDMYGTPSALAPQDTYNDLDAVRELDDAFKRQHLFAMWLCRKQKRVVSLEELLHAIREHRMYRGEWSDGENRRRRCKDILSYVARSFDAELCGQKSERPLLDKNIAEWKTKAWKLPSSVDRHLVCTLAAIIQTASKPNGDCPRDSIQGWWEELASEGKLVKWSRDKYYKLRTVLVRLKLIKIDHNRYYYLPDSKGRCKGIWIVPERKSCGAAAYSYPSLSRPSSPLHNGYVQTDIGILALTDPWETVRPPP